MGVQIADGWNAGIKEMEKYTDSRYGSLDLQEILMIYDSGFRNDMKMRSLVWIECQVIGVLQITWNM